MLTAGDGEADSGSVDGDTAAVMVAAMATTAMAVAEAFRVVVLVAAI